MKTNLESQQLKNIEHRLLILEEEKAGLLKKKDILLQNILTDESNNKYAPHKIIKQNLSTEQKVELYFQLFQGRSDIHATRWENKQGRSGYSVACVNEWKAKVCFKPKVKCGDCSKRIFSSGSLLLVNR